VLDLSRVLAGPWCTQCLADLGAEVLKIESPGEGDESRGWAPPYAGELSAYFTCANRSKRSLVLDLKTADGQATVRALSAHADILVENFKLGTLERFGLGYETLRAANPRLIHCAISGYGRTGPEAPRAGYDFIIQAETGLMSVTGMPDGPPVKAGVAVSDLFAGMYATQAVLAALVEQRATGRGQAIDVALFDCQMAALANVQSSALATGEAPRRYGNAHATVVPYEAFEAADGVFVAALGNDRQYRILCGDILGDTELRDDPRFARNGDRLRHRDELSRRLAAHFARRPRAHWLEQFHRHGLPGGVLRTVTEALESDQVIERGLIHGFGDAVPGDVRVIRYPVKFEGGLPDPTPPPRPGEGGAALADAWLQGAPAR
jgi:crotonobetainyl-CoA:carnitine CoA-transferase CaiB-like acyl-CoA transferase